MNYPIFCGQVIKVSGKVEIAGITHTSLHYLPGNDKVSHKDIIAGIFGALPEGHTPLEKRVKAAQVPPNLDPVLLHASSIRTRYAQHDLGQGEVRCYELEIINGPVTTMGAFDGFRYLRVVE